MTDDTKQSNSSRTEAEDHFLAECFLAFDQKQGKVDITAVAHALGYKNVGSADNKLAQMKKKFNIEIRTFKTEPKTKRLGTNEPGSPKKATLKRTPRKKVVAAPKESEEESESLGARSPSA